MKNISTRDQRPSEKAKWERLAEIVDFVKSISDVPVIVNGDVFKYSDIDEVKKITRKCFVIYHQHRKTELINRRRFCYDC